MSDRFLGAWRVTEYIYSPAGILLGEVRQSRRLHEQRDGALRVVQHCTPSASLADHWMGRFAGEWVFTLTREGNLRRYHGPDVVGYATQWSQGMITGRGIWPRFGCNFTSFSASLTERRQLTGGTFSRAGEIIAVMVGLGVSDEEGDPTVWPVLHGYDSSSDVIPVMLEGDALTLALTRRYGAREDTVGVVGTIPFEQIDIVDAASGTLLHMMRTYAAEGERVRFDLLPLPTTPDGAGDFIGLIDG